MLGGYENLPSIILKRCGVVIVPLLVFNLLTYQCNENHNPIWRVHAHV